MTTHRPTAEDLLPYIAYRVDDAGYGTPSSEFRPGDVLVTWQCGFEPLVVAVGSCLPGVTISEDDAIDLAMDYLQEIGWFAEGPTEPDWAEPTFYMTED